MWGVFSSLHRGATSKAAQDDQSGVLHVKYATASAHYSFDFPAAKIRPHGKPFC